MHKQKKWRNNPWRQAAGWKPERRAKTACGIRRGPAVGRSQAEATGRRKRAQKPLQAAWAPFLDGTRHAATLGGRGASWARLLRQTGRLCPVLSSAPVLRRRVRQSVSTRRFCVAHCVFAVLQQPRSRTFAAEGLTLTGPTLRSRFAASWPWATWRQPPAPLPCAMPFLVQGRAWQSSGALSRQWRRPPILGFLPSGASG